MSGGLFRLQKWLNNCKNWTSRSSIKPVFIQSNNLNNLRLNFIRHRTAGPGKKDGKIKVGKSRSDILRLLTLAGPEKRKLAGAVCLLVISSGVTMSVPFALGRVIDIIYNMDQLKNSSEDEQKQEIGKRMNTVCSALLGVFLLGGVCNFGRIYLIRIAGQNITARLKNKVFSSIVRQETAFFDKTKTGELVNRLSADSQLVSQTVTQQVSDGMRAGLQTLAGIGMMFYTSPQLAFVGLGIVPPVTLWAVLMGAKVKKISKELQNSLADATDLAEEKISNIRTVRMFAKEESEIFAYKSRMDIVLEKAAIEAMIQARFYGMTGLSGNLIILTVLYYGGNLVTTDVISVGGLASFILYSAYVGIGLGGMSTFYAEMMKGLGASSRLWELIDKTPTIPIRGGLIPSSTCHGDIVFSNVHFAYPSRPDVSILNGIDLHIPPDTIVAVVGTSGSGKSTIAGLLLRLYEPKEGSILLDNMDLRELDPAWLREFVGTVSQEPTLFNASIKDNILYGLNDATLVSQEVVENAAKEANAHNFIIDFPEGYETVVGERGVMLSGGQKQRIAIARAIIKNPSILLLDEATSALDAQSEHEVKIALDRIMQGRSVITIAHRLSTIKNADLIAVLDRGRVVEFGAFDELMKMEGRFSALVTQQIRGLE